MRRVLTTLSPRDRRALIVGVTSIGGLMFVGRAVPAWRGWQRAAVASASTAASSAARDQVLARGGRAIHDSLVARRGRLAALAPDWLVGDSPASAGAELAAIVTRAATDAALTLGALDIRTDSVAHGPFVPVHVRVSVTGDVQGVATFLGALDRGPCALNVASLDVQG
ncbi:MAG: GspMb/PilO family protein, partial [Gemmatimonadaceae bacterium]